MQFLIYAHDHTDPQALDRRMKVRQEHMDMIARHKADGHMIIGAALLDEAGKMIGSMIVADFPTREALDEWLEEEPYILGNVWKDVQVIPCKVAPLFENLIPKKVA